MRIILAFLAVTFFNLGPLLAQQAEATSSLMDDSSKATESSSAEENVVVESGEPERDPFRSDIETAESQAEADAPMASSDGAEPVLQGLAINGEHASAVINGRTYGKGKEAQNGIQVVEIRKGEADIIWSGQKRTLRFSPKKTQKEKKSEVPGAVVQPITQVERDPEPNNVQVDTRYQSASLEDSK